MRKAAVRLRVHPSAAFRWRHRWLTVPRKAKASRMAGVVEADETCHLRCYKGRKAMLRAQTARAPYRRNGRAAMSAPIQF